MSLDIWLGLPFAAIVFVYGLLALIRPEKF